MSSQGTNNNIKPDKNLMIASKILDRNSSNSRNKNNSDYQKDLYPQNNIVKRLPSDELADSLLRRTLSHLLGLIPPHAAAVYRLKPNGLYA